MKILYKKQGSSHTYLRADSAFKSFSCFKADEIPAAIDRAEEYTQKGYHVFAWLSYEASAAFDPRHAVKNNSDFPLAHFAVYKNVEECQLDAPNREILPVSVKPKIDRSEYVEAIKKSLEYIHAGDIYQVNYTFRCEVELPLEPREFFVRLTQLHPVPYASFMDTGDIQILSLSPELFLSRRGNQLLTKPMKGTEKRGGTWRSDERKRQELALCPKGRSENIMIVDLMRNDLSRICTKVTTPELFSVERYPSLHQMTGTVTGELNENTSLREILFATFPPGSITGAPKIRATEIINELESSPRGIYTGSILHLKPGGDFDMNVCIRTLSCQNGKTTLGIGSGIVADSGSGPEWDECLLKSSFLNFPPPPEEVFTTLLWDQSKGFRFLLRHLRRLRQTCLWLCREFPLTQIINELKKQRKQNNNFLFARVRITINERSQVAINFSSIDSPKWDQLRVGISTTQLSSKNPFHFHKTSARPLHNEAFASAQVQGLDEAIFFNEKGELCEACISSVFVLTEDKRWLTPKISSGLLAGICRRLAIDSKEVEEVIITRNQLLEAKAVYLGNSLRGLAPVKELLINSENRITFTNLDSIPNWIKAQAH